MDFPGRRIIPSVEFVGCAYLLTHELSMGQLISAAATLVRNFLVVVLISLAGRLPVPAQDFRLFRYSSPSGAQGAIIS